MGANSSACSVATSSGYVAAALCGLVQPDRAGEIREEPPPLVALQRVLRRHRGLALDECEHLRPLGGRKLEEQVRDHSSSFSAASGSTGSSSLSSRNDIESTTIVIRISFRRAPGS